jgi:hypothetical protein
MRSRAANFTESHAKRLFKAAAKADVHERGLSGYIGPQPLRRSLLSAPPKASFARLAPPTVPFIENLKLGTA